MAYDRGGQKVTLCIEANLHAVRTIWPQSARWTEDLVEEENEGNPDVAVSLHRGVGAEGLANPAVDTGVAKDIRHSCYKEGVGFGSALFDARNGFNKLTHYLMLWNVAHLWNQGSRFVFNC
jgi:hypothetical protein